VRSPEYRIDCGLDWKENNLEKCKTLNFYDRLVQADCNKALPLLDNEFSTIFSNTVYWVDDIDLILSELSRIVKPGGKVVLVNYLPAINDYLKIYQGQVSDQWLELIDRNRLAENKHIFTKQEWINRFDRAGLEVTRYIPTVNKLYAHIWNIGLRPFSGFILEMGQELSPEKYVEVKRKWVNTLVTLIEPLLSSSYFNEIKDGEEAEAIFVLQKK
jgi:SAM-dependent methyltransferase